MRLTILTIGVLSVFIATPAFTFNPKTACPKLPKDPVKAQLLAGKLFAEAETAYQESHPIEALEGFLCSHNIIQHENTLFNIAQIAKITELKSSALTILKDYIATVQGASKVDPINDIIADIEDDSADASPNSGPLATVPQEETALAALDTDMQSTRDENDAPPKTRLKLVSLALMSSGGAGLIAGAVLQGLAAAAQGRAEQTDEYPIFQDEQDRMKGLQIGAIAGFAAGGALFTTGLVLFFVSKQSETENSSVNLSFDVSSRGLSIGGRF